jgi:WD40 repeat protein
MSFGFAHSPDGTHLATASVDRTIRILDTTTFEPVRFVPHFVDFASGVSGHADG